MDDETFGAELALELAELRYEEEEKIRALRAKAFVGGYRAGGDLDYYINNELYLSIIYDYIRADEKNPGLSDVDCVVELRRLCEPSVRHYKDCACPICR